MTTTLWEYPSQHYDPWNTDPACVGWKGGAGGGGGAGARPGMQGDKGYVGATPSWVIWQLLMRYTREGDVVVDPMCGSGTTLDVCRDTGRRGLGFDVSPRREDIGGADARALPLVDGAADFVFVDPPYSTHVAYSDEPGCIGRLDAGGADGGRAYYTAMEGVIAEASRVLKDRRYLGLYVSDSYRKGGAGRTGEMMPIGFELFARLRRWFRPIDVVVVTRGNRKLERGNWHKTAADENFFLRGFNYLFIMKKEMGLKGGSAPRGDGPPGPGGGTRAGGGVKGDRTIGEKGGVKGGGKGGGARRGLSGPSGPGSRRR